MVGDCASSQMQLLTQQISLLKSQEENFCSGFISIFIRHLACLQQRYISSDEEIMIFELPELFVLCLAAGLVSMRFFGGYINISKWVGS